MVDEKSGSSDVDMDNDSVFSDSKENLKAPAPVSTTAITRSV